MKANKFCTYGSLISKLGDIKSLTRSTKTHIEDEQGPRFPGSIFALSPWLPGCEVSLAHVLFAWVLGSLFARPCLCSTGSTLVLTLGISGPLQQDLSHLSITAQWNLRYCRFIGYRGSLSSSSLILKESSCVPYRQSLPESPCLPLHLLPIPNTIWNITKSS